MNLTTMTKGKIADKWDVYTKNLLVIIVVIFALNSANQWVWIVGDGKPLPYLILSTWGHIFSYLQNQLWRQCDKGYVQKRVEG